ncbi:hypothetical protein ACFFF5_08900 [Lederbergia wuyishanensis]|uniref:Menaquinol-cytochrome c reductase cytochrome b subunit n=1 Tax=Lederbergia wuyishanensis TaxID=1347903 RepID=A0ABU0D648_9BACI|nr:hypothetical protein [Lederbergia wuyishanensis]MCJ8008720.1 hypothetical protein [Lederbergia wuyishanensis]MDQ0343860.1 menaquinol-cytochrome c reductase cytochrome b subunit [Lederbergia wuyishanensis]
MKIFIQSLLASLALHLIYFGGTILYGYILTKNFTPNIENAVELDSEVAFGYAVDPRFLVFTFIGVALICGILIFSYKKSKGVKNGDHSTI